MASADKCQGKLEIKYEPPLSLETSSHSLISDFGFPIMRYTLLKVCKHLLLERFF